MPIAPGNVGSEEGQRLYENKSPWEVNRKSAFKSDGEDPTTHLSRFHQDCVLPLRLLISDSNEKQCFLHRDSANNLQRMEGSGHETRALLIPSLDSKQMTGGVMGQEWILSFHSI